MPAPSASEYAKTREALTAFDAFESGLLDRLEGLSAIESLALLQRSERLERKVWEAFADECPASNDREALRRMSMFRNLAIWRMIRRCAFPSVEKS